MKSHGISYEISMKSIEISQDEAEAAAGSADPAEAEAAAAPNGAAEAQQMGLDATGFPWIISSFYNVLAGGDWKMTFIFPYIVGNVIIPTDEVIFFRWVETTNQMLYIFFWDY